MEQQPSPPPSPAKKPLVWPIAVNLALLVGINATMGSAVTISGTIMGLVVVNLFAAMLMGLFRRLNWVMAFLLSALLLPLIGFGLCALYIGMNGGLHGGN